MKPITRWLSATAFAAVLGLAPAPEARAQVVREPTTYRQAISANPLGLLVDWFNAEYERVLTSESTAGIGGSYLTLDDEDNATSDRGINLDVFWRYYPQGQPLERFAFGVKGGITEVGGKVYPGFGFDANYSWLMGKRDNFYVGTGFGLKRLLGYERDDENEFVPTIRLVNIGFAF
ncbi:MAG TPA: hypothetical protein VGR37_08685 [Longimicrobiaceae bacterium]|nr:hypothetical protein [Longimicrobiaceae bacterium]